MKRRVLAIMLAVILLAGGTVGYRALAQSQTDPVVQKIIDLGTKDNQVLRWNDYASNRFGGRETGTNAYSDATEWAQWQMKQWGLQTSLDEAGEVPVGFNRGPWFGKMLKPAEKALRFGTPSFTAGTKGIQRGPVVILKADPFSVPSRATGGQAIAKDNVDKKHAAVKDAIAEINANKSAFKGAWVLIGGTSSGFGRDGRRGSKLPDGSYEYLDAEAIPPLTQALADAGALGTIQLAHPTSPLQPAGNSEPPINVLDGYVASWDKLPVLPDIKLLDTQYEEIKALVEKKEPVVLEFDIRNWFKMGPVKYNTVVGVLKGTTYPDEYVIVGAHFDCFSGGTGAIDDGAGFGTAMETLRLITAAGGKPKRSIILLAFAAEEQGLVGSQAWLKHHPELHGKIVMMTEWDTTPYAVTGATVPETWYADFQKITAPLTNLNPKWPFKLNKGMPRAHATSPGGTDSSSFEMQAIPTLTFQASSARPGPDGKDVNYSYNYAWHTTNDLYSELVPYAEHQAHSALATAVVVYGVANLDKPLTRDGFYLADGLYASFMVGAGTEVKQFMTSLDFVNAPAQVANFVRIIEGKPAAPGAGGRGAAAGGRGGGGGGRGGGIPDTPPIGKVDVTKGQILGTIVSDTQKSVAVTTLPKTINAAIKHDAAGVLGISGPNAFYVTTEKNAGFDKRYTAIGKIVAGASAVPEIKKGDPIRVIRLTRVGQAARDFKTDDESFKKLVEAAAARK